MEVYFNSPKKKSCIKFEEKSLNVSMRDVLTVTFLRFVLHFSWLLCSFSVVLPNIYDLSAPTQRESLSSEMTGLFHTETTGRYMDFHYFRIFLTVISVQLANVLSTEVEVGMCRNPA